MSETVVSYKIDRPTTPIPMGRDEFYAEQINQYKMHKKPSRAVSIVDVMLFDLSGEMFIQKRSDDKKHNPGLLDKSMGGHIKFGDSPNYTSMVETIQELQVPSITLNNFEDFFKTFQVLKDYLDTAAVIYEVDQFMAPFEKVIYGDKIEILNFKYLYFGIYNGATRAVDKEAKGILHYKLDDLEKEIKMAPDMFTYDLRFYMKNYRKQIDKMFKALKIK